MPDTMMWHDGNRPEETTEIPESHNARLPASSEEALALQFAGENSGRLKFVPVWNQWMCWDGARWQADRKLQALNRARSVCRSAGRTFSSPHEAKGVASAKTAFAILNLAKADESIAVTADMWDRDPWLLNTPGGTVDLRTGACRPHNRADYITKLTAVAPGGDCLLWLRFLGRVTDGSADLIAYLQRAFGYALTGLTVEHALFFLYGTGANGKSVLMSTVSGILGEYATTAPMDTFIATKNERHPTDLAGLRGARLVMAVETDHGQRWAESKIKTMTGGDKISARFMKQDFFEYTPQFKLLIAGNHKPTLSGVDEAMRRRMNLIPFTVTIPPEERDQNLAENLRAEWPGILRWMIEGCREWTAHRLSPPAIVRDATAEYLEDEDLVGQWIAARCIVDRNAQATIADLFINYRDWANIDGEPSGTIRALRAALDGRGFGRACIGHSGAKGVQGLRLRSPP